VSQAAPGGQTVAIFGYAHYLSQMHFECNRIYHVYNRGDNKQTIFFNRNNYLFFLSKVRKEWLPFADILAYCLMPNHFHFLIIANDLACEPVFLKGKETHMQKLSKYIGKTLSSYTQAINIEQNRTGTLFQKKTKAKLIEGHSYLPACIFYIHSNPIVAGLSTHEDEWEFSSAKDYKGLRNGTICNKERLYAESGLSQEEISGLKKTVTKSELDCIF
jgi:putative transposase